jgi:hypothetical protein
VGGFALQCLAVVKGLHRKLFTDSRGVGEGLWVGKANSVSLSPTSPHCTEYLERRGWTWHSRLQPTLPALLSVSYHSLPMLTFFFLLLLFCKLLQWSRGSVLAFGTPVRGFAPGQSRRNFRVKKSSARLPSEGK